MEKIRIGVIGIGGFASMHHLPLLLKTNEAEITAVCRRNPVELAKAARYFNVPYSYVDYRQMLDEAPLDAVLVSSPHALHYEHTRAALEHGLSVLVDKPLAITVAEARELRDLAAAKELPLMVVCGPPYSPPGQYFRSKIAQGVIGDICFMASYALHNPATGGLFGPAKAKISLEAASAMLNSPVTFTDFRGDPALSGGGGFQDMGSHSVAGILYTTNLHPTEVTAIVNNLTIDLRSSVIIRFDNDAQAMLHQMADAFPSEIAGYRAINGTVYGGAKGSISQDSRTGQIIQQVWGQPLEVIDVDSLPPVAPPAFNFINVLRGREQPLMSIDTAVETVRVIEGVYRSAREGCAVQLA